MNKAYPYNYMWPHFDTGKAQYDASFCCAFSPGSHPVNYTHGQQVGKLTFRLIDKDLFSEAFVREVLPLYKEVWEHLKILHEKQTRK